MKSERTEPRSERDLQADAVRRLSSADRGRAPSRAEAGRFDEPRSWWNRTSDEVAAWFGNTGAMRRRQWDEAAGDHSGQGPVAHVDADTRMVDDLVRRLTDDTALDATRITVTAVEGVVSLDGSVTTIAGARRAEDTALAAPGVVKVRNNLVVA